MVSTELAALAEIRIKFFWSSSGEYAGVIGPRRFRINDWLTSSHRAPERSLSSASRRQLSLSILFDRMHARYIEHNVLAKNF